MERPLWPQTEESSPAEREDRAPWRAHSAAIWWFWFRAALPGKVVPADCAPIVRADRNRRDRLAVTGVAESRVALR